MDKYGVLKRQVATTSWADVYTCPEAAEKTYDSATISVRPLAVDKVTSTLISSIVLCRLSATGGPAEWISLAVVDAPGVTPGDGDYIFYQKDLDGGMTLVVGISMTLGAGQTIRAIAEANTSVSVILNGVEIS